MSKPYALLLAEYIKGVSFGKLETAVIEKTKLLFMDYLASAVAGSGTDTADMLWKALEHDRSLGPCWVPAREERHTTPLLAALINGFNVHILEYDDTHRNTLYHPGAPTLAAAFAAAQATGAKGARLIEGIVAGYEVGINLAESINPAHYVYWHTTGTVGCFAAAAAASKILGLSTEQTVWALGNAGTQAAGLWEFQSDGSLTKPLHPGRAAMSGLLAAFLASKGFSGPATIIEGQRGFCKATASEYDLLRLVPKKDSPPRILEVTFKYYPSCGHTHTPIDAALGLYESVKSSGEKIMKVEVITNKVAMRVAGNKKPRTDSEAKFSIPFCVSYALTYGKITMQAFEEEALKDSLVWDLIDKVELQIGDEMERVFQQKRPTEVIVTLEGGTQLKNRIEYRRGDPENPPTLDEIKTKYYMLTGKVISADMAKEWEQACSILDKFEDISHFPNEQWTEVIRK